MCSCAFNVVDCFFAGMVEITTGTSLGMKPIVTLEEGTKVWHLVCASFFSYLPGWMHKYLFSFETGVAATS